MSYAKLGTQVTVTNFVEKEGVPSDSRFSRYTWQYVNKNGGPDRKFNNNRQFPVVNYQEIEFNSPSGLRKLLQVSRVEDRSGLRQNLVNLGRFVESALAILTWPHRLHKFIRHPGRNITRPIDNSLTVHYIFWRILHWARCAPRCRTVLLYPVFLQAPSVGESSYVPPAEPLSAPSKPLTLSEAQKAALEKDLLEKCDQYPRRTTLRI